MLSSQMSSGLFADRRAHRCGRLDRCCEAPELFRLPQRSEMVWQAVAGLMTGSIVFVDRWIVLEGFRISRPVLR